MHRVSSVRGGTSIPVRDSVLCWSVSVGNSVSDACLDRIIYFVTKAKVGTMPSLQLCNQGIGGCRLEQIEPVHVGMHPPFRRGTVYTAFKRSAPGNRR